MGAKTHSIFDPAIIGPAIRDSFWKLNPLTLARNPVMFVTEVGAVITTVLMFVGHGGHFGFQLRIALWLWFTVLFANLAETMAEGRGKAQAKALRATRTETFANRLKPDGTTEKIAANLLRKGDVVIVSAGELIPGDGEVIEGAATVDESAITGESAPVIRESGGDRSAVTGGTKVLSDVIQIEITSNPGETFLDRMISLVEGASRQKTPNEIALTILLSALTLIFLIAMMSLKAFGIASSVDFTIPVLVALLVCLIPTTIGGLLSAIGSYRKGAADAIRGFVGGKLPETVEKDVKMISGSGGTPLVVASRERVLGTIHLKDIVKGGLADRFERFRAMGIRTVMITGDNPLTAAAIAKEAGVDDFLAEAKPEDKLALCRKELAQRRSLPAIFLFMDWGGFSSRLLGSR
jgi:high-affinity K+ transport system ATPase subunit B